MDDTTLKNAKLVFKGKGVREVLKFFLDSFEKDHFNGDKLAVLHCINFCLSTEPTIEVPSWCKDALYDVMQKHMRFEFKSWDDVFGRPHPQGTHHNTKRELYERRIAVFNRVEELKAAGIPEDRGLFDEAGKDLRVGGKICILSGSLVEKDYLYVKKVRSKYISSEDPKWINLIKDRFFNSL